MNENIDLTKILKNCPEGWEFYSSIAGRVKFVELDLENSDYPITLRIEGDSDFSCTKKGLYWKDYPEGECTLFPSKDQRDWSKFTAPWYKKEKFDPKTLQPFDKVLAKDFDGNSDWTCNLFSHYDKQMDTFQCCCVGDPYTVCIPYNDDTKYLVGTTDEAPEFYKYWED